jgi:predicted NUDIX family phosphoesterase
MGEKILAVSARCVTDMKLPEGISIYPPAVMNQFIRDLEEHLVLEDRDDLEGNPEFRQLIPYVVLHFDNTYFSATRTKKGGDERLFNKRILGFGGHANLVNVPSNALSTQLKLNANRELDEELDIKDSFSLSFSGFINLLTTPVDKDHLGIYILLNLESPLVSIKETSILHDGKFLTKIAITDQYYEVLENWSKAVLEILV